jgi:Vitamin K-dependent gamma-carboxylase
MSTESPAPRAAERTIWQQWVAFWFPAADPTTLGFVRVCTGLLVLYIHLAYTVDLQLFFGKHGWYSAAHIERERNEYPWQTYPFLDWDPSSVLTAKVPEFPHRRKAVMTFIRALPEKRAERERALALVKRVLTADRPEAGTETFRWVSQMSASSELRAVFLAALVGEKGEKGGKTDAQNVELLRATNLTPAAYLLLPDADRKQLADEVTQFVAVLPREDNAQRYVLDHLGMLNPDLRRALYEFLVNLPDDPADRTEKLDYLEYWNSDRDKTLRTGHQIFSVWFHVSDPTQMALIHCGVLFCIVLFTLGLFTRVTSVLVWVAVVGYIHRTQQVLFGMDTMMNILLFYLMIGNSGAALSLDRLLARYRAARASLARHGFIDAPTRAFLAAPPPSTTAGFGLRLIQVHFCIIYASAGLSKLKGNAWWNGLAFWDVVANPEFTLLKYGWYENSLRAIASIKPVFYFMCTLSVWGTLFIEIASPFLMWTRWRLAIVFLATLMHAIIGVLMGLNVFELLMMVMLVSFLKDGVIRDRFRGSADLPKVGFAFDPARPEQQRAAALASAADTDGQLVLKPEPGIAAPTVTAPSGEKVSGPDGTRALFRHLRFLGLLPFLLPLRGWFTKRLFPARPAA